MVRPSLRLRHLFTAVISISLPSCGLEGLHDALTNPCGGPCPTPTPQDCAALSRSSWRIGPFPIPSENELRVTVGDSRTVFLDPFVADHCVGAVASVVWSTDDPSVASVTPQARAYRGGWVTGVRPGSGTVSARIAFADGFEQQTAPRAFVVTPLVPASGTVALEGSVYLESPSDFRRFIPFALPQDASRLDMVVDWASVLNSVDFVLYQGSCSGAVLCSGLQFLPLPSFTGIKPVRKSLGNLSAGTYTIRIDNLGPAAETVRYEVRFTPR